jgi:hypothetical protein
MAQDKASATDHVEAGLTTEATPPTHPCPVCSKATLDANTRQDNVDGRKLRICSEPSCRAKADWATGYAVLLNN